MATSLKYSGLNTLRAFKEEIEKRIPEFEIDKLAQADTGFVSTYQLKKTVNGTSEYVGQKINIAADIFVQSVSTVKTADAADDANGIAVGDKYIEFTIGTTEDPNPTIIKLKLTDLVDTYVGSSSIAVSNSNEISAKVVEANGLSVGANGIELGLASKTTAGALSAEDYTKFFNASEASITVSPGQGSGNVVTAINNVGGAIVPTLGITALQESDFEEIDAATVASLWGTPTPTPTPTKYTVTFNSNDGSEIDPQEIEKDGKITRPADPTKEGYTFAGWYSDGELTSEWDFDNGTVSAAMTLYAKWDPINTP